MDNFVENETDGCTVVSGRTCPCVTERQTQV